MGWLSSGWSRVLCGVLLVTSAIGAACHGMMTEPRARNVVHNSNYCPHCLAAGGPWVTYGSDRKWPNALHGVCGDPHTGPLDHEAGGKFATKIITGTYVQGQTVTLRVKITAPHGGRFSFGVCPLPEDADAAAERKATTQACFDANPLTNAQDGSRYWWFGKKPSAEYTMDFKLPAGVSCKRCALQWHYETGNSCTIPGTPQQHVLSPSMVACNQVGVMEEFWNCADVSIQGGGGKAPPPLPASTAPGKKAAEKRKLKKKKREAFAFPAAAVPDDRALRLLLLIVAAAALALAPLVTVAAVGAGAAAYAIAGTQTANAHVPATQPRPQSAPTPFQSTLVPPTPQPHEPAPSSQNIFASVRYRRRPASKCPHPP